MQGLLYDLPEVLATVSPSQFAGCEGRIHVKSGSFIARAPEGCDAYVLKHVLHNWSDDDCVKILTLLRDQLPAHGRVLICEMVIQSDPAPTPAKMLDIEMLLLTVGGKERSSEEFRDVLVSAGLRIGRIVSTPSPLSVLEAFPTRQSPTPTPSKSDTFVCTLPGVSCEVVGSEAWSKCDVELSIIADLMARYRASPPSATSGHSTMEQPADVFR